ncbi:response regulator [Mucilaginibacter sp. UR6-1]|uniref:response regulator n=1 Tax=Mucilaginibacter sp. UR6-1 TaxID=1435643 RepID=UPI001E55F761|nr:response regulator [Mucilaginibacter sp. UR6-1]MCC8409308.1 response regulator [Mucilaginibacter sp. UR6-1]
MDLSLIVIDESDLDCFIAQKIIQHTYKNSVVKLYHNPQTAFDAIRAKSVGISLPAIIFLDLQMPIMNGFAFLDAFEKLADEITRQYKIFILSSTRNNSDISKGLSYKTVSGIIEKPLTKEKLQDIMPQHEVQ